VGVTFRDEPRGECGKPHLPVKPWLVRGRLSRAAGEVARFPFEFDRDPEDAVIADLEQDFWAFLGHALKETVGVETAPRGGVLVEGVQGSWEKALVTW
jgi:hypothetical protein